MYRLNLSIFSFWEYSGNIYIPSLAEILVSVTLVSVGVVAFGVISKFFPIFSDEHGTEAH
jgi:Ni/Fe-hydrogenase subunit HybB-like protein